MLLQPALRRQQQKTQATYRPCFWIYLMKTLPKKHLKTHCPKGDINEDIQLVIQLYITHQSWIKRSANHTGTERSMCSAQEVAQRPVDNFKARPAASTTSFLRQLWLQKFIQESNIPLILVHWKIHHLQFYSLLCRKGWFPLLCFLIGDARCPESSPSCKKVAGTYLENQCRRKLVKRSCWKWWRDEEKYCRLS